MKNMPTTVVYFVFVVLCLLKLLQAESDKVYVESQSGPIVGCVKDLGNCKKVKQFSGIPYAKPPVNELRWKEPQPVETWSEVLDGCKFYHPRCPQLAFVMEVEERGQISEDCLYLNIYTPVHVTSTSKLPVMVWIHGGGFTMGSGNDQDGSYLAAFTDVIVITINYRIGVLGFLSFPGTSSKGNYGMLDQIAALKWVKNNIAYFGGDPGSVTIFGESAGGVAVSLLTLSPLAKGLFQRAISQSGTAVSDWSSSMFENDEDVRKFSSKVGCPSDDGQTIEEVLSCMRKVNTYELLKEQSKQSSAGFGNLTCPLIDGEFLSDSPLKLLEEGKVNDVDQIIGVTKDEGSFIIFFLNLTHLPIEDIADMYVPRDDTFEVVKDAAVHQYTAHGEEDPITASCNLVGDLLFNAGADATARHVSKVGKKTFFYVFGHACKFKGIPDWIGVPHGIDVGYLFGVAFNKSAIVYPTCPHYSDMEQGLTLAFMRLWTNFAKTGNPSIVEDGIDWPQFSAKDPVYLEIKMVPEVKRNFRSQQFVFWNNYIPKLKAHFRANKPWPDTGNTKTASKDEL